MGALAECKKLGRNEISELLSRFRDGDKAAGWDIVSSCQRLIWKLARRAADAYRVDEDDLSQELTMLVYRSLATYDPQKGSLTNFVCMIAKNRLGLIAKRLQGKEVSGIIGRIGSSVDGEDTQTHEPEAPEDDRQAMFNELDEIAADVPPIGIKALRLGYLDELSKEACTKRLVADFPDEFAGVRIGSRQDYVNDITKESIKQLQESLGVSEPAANTDGSDRWAPKAEYKSADAETMEYVRQHPAKSVADVHRDLTQRGKKVSYTAVRIAANKLGPEQLREAIIEYALEHPACPAEKLHTALCRQGLAITLDLVRRTLVANGLARTESDLRPEVIDYAKRHPSESVQEIRASFLQRGEYISLESVRKILRDGGIDRSRRPRVSDAVRRSIIEYANENPTRSALAIRIEFRRRGEHLSVNALRRILGDVRRARKSPLHGRKTPDDLRDSIVRMAQSEPSFSAVDIHKELLNQGHELHVHTVRRIMAAHGLARSKVSRGTDVSREVREQLIRYAKEHPLKRVTEIHRDFRERGAEVGHVQTVGRILKKAGIR